MTACVYVTDGWGIHDERWTQALTDLGFSPHIVRLGIDTADPAELIVHVTRHSGPETPILAGPLTTVTRHLIDLPARVIGLSWGFDLHDLQDAAWLTQLSGLIVDSPATKDIALAAGVEPARITFLPWGVDLEVFQESGPTADLLSFGIPAGARTVLSLRAHEPLYRVADIIEAFADADVPNTHLLIGNTGSLTEQLMNQAHQRGTSGRTHFLGSIPETNLPALLRAVDLYVSASSVDGTSVTLLQAMACGTRAVVSNISGNTYWIVHGESGSVFDPEDIDGLRNILIAEFAGEIGVHRSLAQKARERVVAEADWAKNSRKLLDALCK